MRLAIMSFPLLLGVWGSIPAAAAEGGARWDRSAVVGAGAEPFAYAVRPHAPGVTFARPVHTQVYWWEGERRLLIAGIAGELYDGASFGGSGPAEPSLRLPELVAPLFDVEPAKLQLALMSTLFDREFPRRRFLYAFFSTANPAPARDRVVRFTVAGCDPLVLGDPLEILSWPSNGHNGGDMAWGPADGMLYISAGDRSAPGDPDNTGQRVDGIHGSILRIDVHSTQPYAVPPDNPFVGMEVVRPEIWSYGLRNPWRMAFHPQRHELWVGDNGDESWEMVHRIEKGANAGWSAFEGSSVFRPANPLGGPNRVHSPAIVQHPHSEMRSVIGGIFYRGEALPELRDHYLYACYFTKRLWAFSYRDGKVGEPFQIADAGGDVVAITEDWDREPILTCHDGNLLRLEKLAGTVATRAWPDRLSATGLFAAAGTHALAAGVYPYQTNAAAWADGASKDRFVAIGEGAAMRAPGGIEVEKSWELPRGSIVGQTLSLGGRRIETQLLYFDGTWRGYSYRWDEAGREANLVAAGGEKALVSGQPWRFASRAECLTCHTHRSNFLLSLTTRQLDRPGASGANQIDEFVGKQLLSPVAKRGEPVVDPTAAGAHGLDARARSYLDLNCAHCHRETGLGGRAGFQLLVSLSLADTGLLDARPVVGLLGRPEARIVAPGDPDNSELLARMARRGAGQMPLLGSQRVDAEGVALIREWIGSLGGGRKPAR